ncbi:MAG: YkgJ family cysteine cluster protein [Candidatus Omnitrophica bacterium]|nr:YkgJ family cysteine cluster protein [Candidatus Omnitrophota bacterium]
MAIIPLKQFVPSDVCLSCDGCCRFKEPGTIWRPKLTDEETHEIQGSQLAHIILHQDVRDSGQFIKTKPGCGEHLCHFFNPENHACAIYHGRPFECELYPYVISRSSGETALYIHIYCPFVQKTQGQEIEANYREYLREFFKQKDVLGFLIRNREFLNDYSAYQEELQKVFVIDGV